MSQSLVFCLFCLSSPLREQDHSSLGFLKRAGSPLTNGHLDWVSSVRFALYRTRIISGSYNLLSAIGLLLNVSRWKDIRAGLSSLLVSWWTTHYFRKLEVIGLRLGFGEHKLVI